MSDDRVEQAIELAQSGKAESARKLLELIIKDDRNNIPAWQLYAETWLKVSDKIRVWEVCLRYNPSNPQVQQVLATLALNQVEKEPMQLVKTMDPSGTESTFGETNSSQWLLWGSIGLFIVVAAIAVLIIRNSKPINPAEYRHTQPVEYYLYVPKAYAADQEWPLFVGIHGAGGSGMDCWNLWQSYADKEGFILLCPSVPGDSAGFYLDVGETTVWSAIGELKKEYRVKPRMFFTGFSAGAFFIQGFTYHYPSYVSGLSILSSGVYLDPNLFAEVIPMVVVIGDQDNASAVQTSQIFVRDLRQFGFDVQYELMPGVGHAVTKKGIDLTIDLFRQIRDR